MQHTDRKQHTEKKHAARGRQRRAGKYPRPLVILFAAAIALAAVLVWLVATMGTNPDLSMPYQLADAGDQEQYSDFALQTETAFAEDLTVVLSEDQTGGIELQGPDVRGLLLNLSDQEVLYAKGAYKKIYPASVTKLMTALIAYENNPDMSAQVTMQDSDFELGSDAQESDLASGDVVTMDQLMHMLIVYSANDAAMAIARTVGGTTEKFVDMMNERAAELGMTGTHFANPTGLHDDDHYTTAYDVYLMINALYSEYPEEFAELSSLGQYEVKATGSDGQENDFVLYATDEFLTGNYSLPTGITIKGSKTGTTSQAGACLALIVQDAYGKNYAAIIMNDTSHDLLYADMTTLLKSISADQE